MWGNCTPDLTLSVASRLCLSDMVTGSGITRPRVFVSSTIRDLEDLRDALKFWLEEMGFEVQMSEHNDFERRPEATTFEACFEAISESDYYLLIIGRNRGTWYDKRNRVSVTQQEYRVAYDSAMKTGKPKPVMCVRSDVQTILRERRKMGLPIDESLLEDWKFTAGFLREVKREHEGRDAAPGPNWITPFANFRELVAALRGSMRIRGPLPKVAQLESLRHELEANLRETMRDLKGKPSYHSGWLNRMRRDLEIGEDDLKSPDGAMSVTFEQISDLNVYINTCLVVPEHFLRTSTDEAIVSGVFLDYDRSADRFAPSSLLTALHQLREELDRYRMRYGWVASKVQADLAAKWATVRDSKLGASVSAMSLLAVYSLHDSHQNVQRFLVAILRYLYGHTKDVDVMTRPISPVPKFAEEVKAESVSEDQLRRWLESDEFLLRLGMIDITPEQRRNREATEQVLRQLLGNEAYEKLEMRNRDRLMSQYFGNQEQDDSEGGH